MKMEVWEIIGSIADVVSILAAIISVTTLVFTCRIRREMLKHVERSDYREDIDEKIESLSAIQSFLGEKDCSEQDKSNSFDEIEVILSELRSYYETILPRKLSKEIVACNNFISATNSPYSAEFVKDIRKRLVSIVAKLKKEKQVL